MTIHDYLWPYVTIHDILRMTIIFLAKVFFFHTIRNIVLKYLIFFFFQTFEISSQEIFKSLFSYAVVNEIAVCMLHA